MMRKGTDFPSQPRKERIQFVPISVVVHAAERDGRYSPGCRAEGSQAGIRVIALPPEPSRRRAFNAGEDPLGSRERAARDSVRTRVL